MSEAEALRDELEKINNKLEIAKSNFHFADTREMIDYYTYIIMANEIMYEFLNRKYKNICKLERRVV